MLVKVYRPVGPFPAGGVLSQWLDTVKVGDSVAMSSPHGGITFDMGAATVQIKNELAGTTTNQPVRDVAMLAGGTGIAPMFQVLSAAASAPPESAGAGVRCSP